MRFIFNDPSFKERRRQLRKELSQPEQVLWSVLRNRQCGGAKFRRQYSIGWYIVDFYCPEKKLAVEVDGDSHYSEHGEQYDARRTRFLESLGIKVIRFTNVDVMESTEGCFEVLEKLLSDSNEE